MRRSLRVCCLALLCSSLHFAPSAEAKTVKRASNLKLNYELLQAAASGDTMAIRRLAPRGAILEARDAQYGFTPLMWASWKANIGTMRELIKRGANVNARSNSAQPAPIVLMPHTVLSRDEQVVEGGSITTVVGAGYAAYNSGITPLLLAASSRSALAVQTLLDKGANPNAATVSGETPLDAAAAAGYLPSVQMLIKRGAEVNTQDASGSTPLINAVLQGNTDIVKTLLAAGAEVKGTWRGNSPHRLAAMLGRREIASMLGLHEVNRILARTNTNKPVTKPTPQREVVKIINADGSVQLYR